MSFCYSNLGDSMRPVENGYVPIEGEVLFETYATEEQLREAFPGRQAAQEAAEIAALSSAARAERDRQLMEVYDRGTQMARRELEMTTDAPYIVKLKSKLLELHQYAILLQDVPSQATFPHTITWPEIPNGELE